MRGDLLALGVVAAAAALGRRGARAVEFSSSRAVSNYLMREVLHGAVERTVEATSPTWNRSYASGSASIHVYRVTEDGGQSISLHLYTRGAYNIGIRAYRSDDDGLKHQILKIPYKPRTIAGTRYPVSGYPHEDIERLAAYMAAVARELHHDDPADWAEDVARARRVPWPYPKHSGSRAIFEQGPRPGEVIGYRVARYERASNEAVSGADSRLRFPVFPGAVHEAPGLGLFFTHEPAYAREHYGVHDLNILLRYAVLPSDMTSGSMEDRQPEFSVKRPRLLSWELWSDDEG